MKTFRYILTLFALLAAGAFAFAAPIAAPSSADVTHLHVQLVVPASNLKPGETAKGGLYFKLEPGWHVYWKNAGDAGEPPHIKWTLPDGITAGPLEFPVPQRLPVSTLMDYGYENEVLYPFEIKTATGAKAGDAVLHAKVDWLVCREECIPGKAELETTRTVGPGGANVEPDAGLFARLGNKLPKPLPTSAKASFQTTATGYRLTLETGKREAEAAFFPADQDVIDNPSPQKVTPNAKGLTLDLKKDASFATNPAQLRGVITLAGGRSYEIAASAGGAATDSAAVPVAAQRAAPVPAATQQAAPTAAPVVPQKRMAISSIPAPPQKGLAETIGLAFLGGLILNLMPCVFPVLFLKGLGLVQSSSEERSKLRLHGAVYTLGIVVSFWVLVAALLALRAAGSRLGWGFQFQSPIFLLLMASLLFFLGLSLAGQFEIGLTLTSAGGSLAAKQGYTGSFFTGVLAVIVATPCTAPFMGAAIGYAIAAPAAVTFAIFTALALGLAAPYVALTLQPAWTRLLPKPGVWMEYLKQAVSVPIFATVIWLAWVVAGSYGAETLVALLSSFLLLAIAGWFLGRWPAKGWPAAIAVVLALCVVALSVVAKINAERVDPGFRADKVLSLNLTPGDLSKTQLSSGTDWSTWSADKVDHYLSSGTPVFVDFTAKWCLSCQVNERVALSRPEVQKAFGDAHVALLRADWTQHDEAIAQALEKLGRSGVPAYALYTPGEAAPKLLPEALTPGIVLDFLNGLPKTSASAQK